MAQTLNVYLVNKAGDLSGRFEEAHRKTCADTLKTYLEATLGGVAKYDKAAVTWFSGTTAPTDADFVCYLLTSASDSIVATKATKDITLGLSGSTMLSVADKAVVCEVYMRQIVQGGDQRANATTNRETAVANCILHELAHNLCDATTPVVVDIHKVKGGVICREPDGNPLKGTESPNAVDNTTFQTGFNRRVGGVKQYTGAMTP
ncbi:hypothetical protein [Muricoccus radiodurans]|uniref:hypothetical protein n=1 Tax=Muricoccus radiodurans TaxID=2231721 RepID=UPI003CEAEE88